MDIRPYGRQFSEVVKMLYQDGVLVRYPEQIKRDDLETDAGVDIILTLKGLTPKKFSDYSQMLLMAAYQEAHRYEDEKYKFAKFEVAINRTAKGRKAMGPIRTYCAAKHSDSETMVFGEEALGYTLPEEYKRRPFLINKIDEIIDIPDTTSPGAYTKKQNPYKVVRLIISIREGLKGSEARARRQEMIEALKGAVDRSFPALEEGKSGRKMIK